MSKCNCKFGATGATANRRDASDAPSNRDRHIADPVLARQRTLQLWRKRRRQELDLEHNLLARAGCRAVRAKGGAEEGLVDEEVEGDGRLCKRETGRSARGSLRQDECAGPRKAGQGERHQEVKKKSSTSSEKPRRLLNEEYQCHESCVVMRRSRTARKEAPPSLRKSEEDVRPAAAPLALQASPS